MKKTFRLTTAFIDSPKCSTTVSRARFADGQNLYLNVTSNGAKSWLFVWFDQTAGKQREMGLGSYTGDGRAACVDLKTARNLAEDCRSSLRRGVNPLEEKVRAKVGPITFETIFKLTIEQTKPSWKAKNGVYAQQADWEGKIANHAAKLLDMPLGRISEPLVADLLRPIWHLKRDTADRLLWIINEVFLTALANPEISRFHGPNPAANVAKKLGKRVKAKIVKQPSLAYAKVPAAIAKLLADGRMQAKASVFCTLTTTRSDEARLMQWSEIDWDAKLWTVPGERMKVENENDAEGDHLVPLSDAAIAVLRSISPVLGNPFVFAGQKDGQAISEGALNVTIAGTKRKGGILFLQGEATQHGMRSSFRTWGEEEAKLNVKALEMCLAHKVGSSDTERSYARADLLDERRAALQLWGQHCRPAAKLALVAA